MSAIALARIIEAYRRAVVALPASFEPLNAELLRPSTELALAVVLAVFAGLSLPALGPAGPMILSFKQALNLGARGDALDRAARTAAAAQDSASLDRASEQLRDALANIGPGPIRQILQRPEFAQLRSFVSGIRPQLFPPSESAAPAMPSGLPAQPAPSVNRAAVYWALGAASAVGLLLVAAGMAPRRSGA